MAKNEKDALKVNLNEISAMLIGQNPWRKFQILKPTKM